MTWHCIVYSAYCITLYGSINSNSAVYRVLLLTTELVYSHLSRIGKSARKGCSECRLVDVDFPHLPDGLMTGTYHGRVPCAYQVTLQTTSIDRENRPRLGSEPSSTSTWYRSKMGAHKMNTKMVASEWSRTILFHRRTSRRLHLPNRFNVKNTHTHNNCREKQVRNPSQPQVCYCP